jgi:hypothetical protein
LIFYCLLIVNTLAGTLSAPRAGKPQNNPGLTGLEPLLKLTMPYSWPLQAHHVGLSRVAAYRMSANSKLRIYDFIVTQKVPHDQNATRCLRHSCPNAADAHANATSDFLQAVLLEALFGRCDTAFFDAEARVRVPWQKSVAYARWMPRHGARRVDCD